MAGKNPVNYRPGLLRRGNPKMGGESGNFTRLPGVWAGRRRQFAALAGIWRDVGLPGVSAGAFSCRLTRKQT